MFPDIFKFTDDLADLKRQYLIAVKSAHPDTGGSTEQFQTLQIAYEEAQKAIANKIPWVGSTTVQVSPDRSYRYARSVAHPSGDYAVYTPPYTYRDARAVVVYSDALSDRVAHSKAMPSLCRRSLPTSAQPSALLSFPEIEPSHGSNEVVFMSKDRHLIPLDALMGRFTVPMEHKLWMITRLFDVMTALEVAVCAHNGLDSVSVAFDMRKHTIAILGGWVYSETYGDRLSVVPGYALPFVPSNKKANPDIDRWCIRQLILKILEVTNADLMTGKVVPRNIASFLSTIQNSSVPALDLYNQWVDLRDKWVPRKWVDFDFQANLKGA